MFSHVMVGVNDLEASRKFYDAVMGTLGIGPGVANRKRYFYRSRSGTFGITCGDHRRMHIHESFFIEEFVDRECKRVTDTEYRTECIGAETQMRFLA